MSAATYLGVVPARGGSKGVPRKNLADLGGKSLLQRTIETAQASDRLHAFLVSSDDEEILSRARSVGASVVQRPAHLAADDSPMIEAALHALDHAAQAFGSQPDVLVLLQPTSPFRDARDVDAAIAAFERSGADTLASVVPVEQHPCNCVRRVDEKLMRAVPIPFSGAQRQDFPEFHYLDGAIFIGRADALRERRTFVDENTELFRLDPIHGLDVNGELELALARALANGSIR
jgi:CMP-N,N'-diacetyllegionaminic acid synthase